jgi:hypothetical protein
MSTAYPPPSSAVYPGAHARTPSGGAAGTIVLVGLLVQVLGAFLLLYLLSVLFGFSIAHPYPYAWVAGIFGLSIGVFAVLFPILTYVFSYRRIERGEYEEAQTPTLVFAILSLLTLGLISGILYLIAYIKLGDAIRDRRVPAGGYSQPNFTGPGYPAPPVQVACRSCGRVSFQGQFGFCPNCGQKMSP